ncbi:unnamed protein product [Rhodiola kirilowii]
MDDFKVVLRLEFHDQVKAFTVPFNNTMCILDGQKACVVLTTRSSVNDAKMLSALQFKKGVRKNEESYLAILKEYDDETVVGQAKVPQSVAKVLEEFQDVIPDELPKKLPP